MASIAGAGHSSVLSHNVAQSLILLAVVGLATGLAAYLLAGLIGICLIAVALIGLALVGPKLPAETLLRLYAARRLPPDDSQLSSLVDVLSWRAGLLQRPDLYLIPSSTLNAFAAGTSARPAIALTEGLVRRLSMRQLAGVIAHEIGHIRNGDLWIMGLADVAARLLQPLAFVALALAAVNALAWQSGAPMLSWPAIAILYLTPAIVNLVQLALPRDREYAADRLAVTLTGDADGLAAALERIEPYTGHFLEDLTPPVAARRVPQPSLLRTHPSAGQRVDRLLALTQSASASASPLVIVERPYVSLVGVGPAALRPRYRWPGVWY